MKELKYTSRFKKDLKRILNQPQKLKALQEVIPGTRLAGRLHRMCGMSY